MVASQKDARLVRGQGMSSNHLIVGLGGTGGKIIPAFRKTIFQEFRMEESGCRQRRLPLRRFQ
jgi:hypothetical protein